MDTNKSNNVAIIGAGISGLSLAYALAKKDSGFKLTIFESSSKLGGHSLTTDPVDFKETNGSTESTKLPPVDLGFQVMNRTTYPYLSEIFRELNVETEPSDMSFAVSTNGGELEWASHNLDSILAQRKNAVSPRFITMLRDVFRFSSLAKEVLSPDWQYPNITLGEYLDKRGFTKSFASDYLIPMTAAVWSVPHSQMLDFPVVPLISFWDNHHLLNPIADRPRWRVVKGRSQKYVAAIEKFLLERKNCATRIVVNAKVASVNETQNGKFIVSYFDENSKEIIDSQEFDHVVFATHAPVTSAILENSRPFADKSKGIIPQSELDIINNIPYQKNDIYYHTDIKQMPISRKAWASWNVLTDATSDTDKEKGVCVTYWLNRLQNLEAGLPDLLCTLNPIHKIPESKIIQHIVLDHPVFTPQSIEAQFKINNIQSTASPEQRKIWFAGAYLGHGFHEDGVRSAMAIASRFNAAPSFVTAKKPALEIVRGPSPVSSYKDAVTSFLFSAIANNIIKKGYLRVVLPDGNELGPFGRSSKAEAIGLKEPTCTLWVENYEALYQCIKDSDIGIGEAYMDGLIKFDGKDGVLDLLNILVINMNQLVEYDTQSLLSLFFKTKSPTFLLGMALYRLGNALNNIKHRFRKNTIEGSRKNIQAHYDLGNPLYELFLDKSMTYSCGIHTKEFGAELEDSTSELPLYDAQLAKLDAIIRKAGLKKDDVVLEIGCGWGSFAIRAAETIGCYVIGVTISTEQLKIAKQRVAEKGLEHLIDLRICDYRKLGVEAGMPPQGFFDKVVSIEMLEAVGEEHLSTFFQVVDRMMKPNGVALIQVIGIPDDRYEIYCNGSDFIREHVFPGGHLPSPGALHEAIEGTGLVLKNTDDIGPDYAVTLRMWRENFMSRQESVLNLGYPERFIRLWEFYLVYCEIGFRQRALHDWHLKFEKVGLKDATEIHQSITSANKVQKDNFTAFLLSFWVLMCSVAVSRIGSIALLIPLFMLFQLVSSYAVGSISFAKMIGQKVKTEAARKVPREVRYTKQMMVQLVSSVISSALIGYVYLTNKNDIDTVATPSKDYSQYQAATMIGLGNYAGILFCTVAGNFMKFLGNSRIILISLMLILGSVLLLETSRDESKNNFEVFFGMTLMMLFDVIASVFSNLQQTLFKPYLTAQAATMAAASAIRVTGYGLLISWSTKNIDKFSIPLGLVLIPLAFLWNVWETYSTFAIYKESRANSINTDELIRSKPEIFLKSKDQIVSDLAAKA